MTADEDAASSVAAFVAYEARAVEELARCASAISPSLHSLLPEIAERLSTQLDAVRANGAFWSQMLEDMELVHAPSEEVCPGSDAPPSGGEAADAAQANVHGVLLQLRREWSEEGAAERRQSFEPILEALAHFVPSGRSLAGGASGDRGAAGGAAGGDGPAAAEGSTERRVRVLVRRSALRCPAPTSLPPASSSPAALTRMLLTAPHSRTRRSPERASEGWLTRRPC